jgi:hypothetical protein
MTRSIILSRNANAPLLVTYQGQLSAHKNNLSIGRKAICRAKVCHGMPRATKGIDVERPLVYIAGGRPRLKLNRRPQRRDNAYSFDGFNLRKPHERPTGGEDSTVRAVQMSRGLTITTFQFLHVSDHGRVTGRTVAQLWHSECTSGRTAKSRSLLTVTKDYVPATATNRPKGAWS